MLKKLPPFLLLVRYGLRQVASAAVLIVLWLLRPIGFRELLLFAGAGLIGWGLLPVYPPAAFIAPGIIITYVAVFGVP